MCSLSYIPKKGAYILSHNRDELPRRESSSKLVRKELEGRELVYPKDISAGGTWIGADSNGLSACILNGGSLSYLRNTPYRASRGTVIPALLELGSIEKFKGQWSSEGIEPFTLIICEGEELWQLIHNPKEDIWQALDAQKTHFWSSTKLYHPQIRANRATRFNHWLEQNKNPSAQELRNFHLSTQINELEGGLVLPQGFPLKTMNFCQIEKSVDKYQFNYHYLDKGLRDKHIW